MFFCYQVEKGGPITMCINPEQVEEWHLQIDEQLRHEVHNLSFSIFTIVTSMSMVFKMAFLHQACVNLVHRPEILGHLHP